MERVRPNALDRVIASMAPRWAMRRAQARLILRHYEGAATGRRTQGWRHSATDANSAMAPSLAKLRDAARDLVRNNGYAESAVGTICDHAISWGIVAAEEHELWNRHVGCTDIDADGDLDLAGLQKLVMRTVAESGEVLVRRRWRRPEDGLALPFQVQVLEADFLDTSKDTTLATGNRVVKGIEVDLLGRRVAYWLFRNHPGSSTHPGGSLISGSIRVPAVDILHVYDKKRPGQVRGASWFAPVLLRFKDYDEYEDATLMKQKIAACLAVLTSDSDGMASALGTSQTQDGATSTTPEIDSLEPGMILNIQPGRDVHVVNPPSVADYRDFSTINLRAIATGIGIPYEDLTGDYTGMPFSAARMSRLRHHARVEDWRWRIIIPKFLQPLWKWAGEAAELVGRPMPTSTEWTAPALPMIDEDREVRAIVLKVRAGLMSLPEALRQLGVNPKKSLKEYAAAVKLLDELGLVLDLDPRKMTQAGQAQGGQSGGGAAVDGKTKKGKKKPAGDDPDAAVDDDEAVDIEDDE